MPVDCKPYADAMPTQRHQYNGSLLTMLYRDFADNNIMRCVNGSDSVLDIGCGEGILLEKLANRRLAGNHLWGIDRNAENVEICRSYRLSVINADCYDLCFKDNSIDCCIITDVLEHLDKPDKLMFEARRVLKNNGRVVIQIPNDRFSNFARFAAFRLKYDFTVGHLKQWSPKELAIFLSKMGFKVAKRFNIPGYFWPVSFHHLAVAYKV